MRLSEVLASEAGLLFHGTATKAAAESILKDGLIRPAEKRSKTALAPVAGHAYFTPDLAQACKYAGVRPGDDFQAAWLSGRWKDERFSYVFAVRRDDLTDVAPDEDFVLYFVLATNVGQFKPELDIVAARKQAAQSLGHTHPWRFPTDKAGKAELHRVLEEIYALSGGERGWDVFQSVHRGDDEFADAVKLGKRVIKKLSDASKDALVRWGAAVAHRGTVPLAAGWKFDKLRAKSLGIRAQNFHKVAERIF